MRPILFLLLTLAACHPTNPKPERKGSSALFLNLCALRTVACYDATTDSFATESKTCQQLVSSGGSLKSATQEYTIKGPGEACDNAMMLKGLATNEKSEADGISEAVVWPASLALRYSYDAKACGFTPSVDCYPKATEAEKSALTEAMKEAFPNLSKEAIVVEQSLSFEIDGDGMPDKLYTVFATPEQGPTDAFHSTANGVFWAKSGDLKKLQVVSKSDNGGFDLWLSAAVDLNADNRAELFFSGSFGADYTFEAYSFDGKEFRSILVENEMIQ